MGVNQSWRKFGRVCGYKIMRSEGMRILDEMDDQKASAIEGEGWQLGGVSPGFI